MKEAIEGGRRRGYSSSKENRVYVNMKEARGKGKSGTTYRGGSGNKPRVKRT